MYQLSKKQIAIFAAAASVPVMMFFQNCGQSGQISVQENAPQTQSQAAEVINPDQTTDVLIINPAPQIEQPQVAQASSDQTAVDQPATVIEPVVQIGKCAALQISDVLLNLESISVASADETQYQVSFSFIDSDQTVSFNKTSLKVKALNSFKTKQIFLKWTDTGNQILSSNNQALNLSLPSGLSAGIKVTLSQEVDVQAGQVFNLQFMMNPADQFVENPEQCVFRPVIQLAQLDLIADVLPPVQDAPPVVVDPPPEVVAPVVSGDDDQEECVAEDDDHKHRGHVKKDEDNEDDRDDDKKHKEHKEHKEHKDKKLKKCKKKKNHEKHHDKKDHDDKDDDHNHEDRKDSKSSHD